MRCAARAAVAALAALVWASCTPGARGGPWRAASDDDTPRGPAFRALGSDAAARTVDLVADGKHAYQYALRREASGVTSDLRAVVFDRDRAYAAGDGGVVLRRTADGDWRREATPTGQRIRALLVVPEDDRQPRDPARDEPLVAVGDGGTVLRRDAAGAWAVEIAPSTADLYDLVGDRAALYAVGDHGTLLVRRGGTWALIATHTDADLRRFDGRVAVGAGGALVDCALWDREQRQVAHEVACVPRPSPTQADLLAVLDAHAADGWHAYGAAGTVLSAPTTQPITAIAGAPLAGGATITAAVTNHWLASVGTVATLLVGARGTVVFASAGAAPRSATIDGEPDLFGVATESLDAFAVGAHGTIVHLQTIGVDIPVVRLL